MAHRERSEDATKDVLGRRMLEDEAEQDQPREAVQPTRLDKDLQQASVPHSAAASEETEAVETRCSSHCELQCAARVSMQIQPARRGPSWVGGGAKNVHNTRQHEGGGCDVCREREAGQCNFVLRNFSCIARVMARPSLYKSQAKGRNYRVSQRGTSRDETIRIHTGDAYEEDRWNDYYIESAPPHNPGSPNDNGVPQNRLAVCSLSSFSRDHEYDVRLLPGERSVRSTRVRSH